MRRRHLAALAAATVATASGAAAALAGDNASGFRTPHPAMLAKVDRQDVTITPIITVGDTLAGGFRFEAIPDGIGVRTRGQGRADVYVNHETGKAPFPYVTATPSATNGENDFDNAQVSRLALNQHSAGVLSGSFVIATNEGYQRFCSLFIASERESFDREILLTNEETPDWFFRQADSWPPPLDNTGAEEAGLVVALDVRTGKHRPIYGMGRHNHENSVAIPGYGKPVMLSGDDTFTSGSLTIPAGGPLAAGTAPAQSQVYSYLAADTDALWEDEGQLWAFVSDNAALNDYYDFTPGSAASTTGRFIPVPPQVATGRNPDGSEVRAADLGYPAPPTNGSWQRDLRSIAPLGVDGPQWVLEYWSQLNGVFPFVRIEDIAYDKREGKGNVVYLADSGRGTAGAPQAGRSTNGRVWRMVLDPSDPTRVLSLSVFVEGDDLPVKTRAEVHQPDNLETTQTSLYVTEDPGSSQQFPIGSTDPNATPGRLWRVPLVGNGTGAPEVIVAVDQSADSGPTDVDGRPAGNLGAWEASGVVDASEAFGPGALLVDVQAHTLWIEKAPGDDNNGDGQPDFTYKREGGQLLLVRVPNG